YNCNIGDQVQRTYLQRGLFQLKGHTFKFEKFGNQQRQFFREFGSWLEYRITEESVYCLFCYLFKEDNGVQAGGDTFAGKGFKNWKKKEKLKIHEGCVNSAHNRARQKCERQSKKTQSEYKNRLNVVVDYIQFILNQALAFRGHNDSDGSSNKGNFLELLRFLVDY
ncbi:hypothetical protein CICLE_v10017619mg, partial [Citrus x clementina]